jgi:carbonic anhydrase/acetyltransferase-like protein (isoleucine patch superfamily)
MLYENPAGMKPRVAESAIVHEDAKIIGNVCIGDNVRIGPNAVIRADEPCLEGNLEGIVVEPDVCIQDDVIIHALSGTSVRIGKGTTLAHEAMIIGPCDVGENCFIAFKCLLFKATLGDGVVIQHGALVEWVSIKAGREVPAMATLLTQKDVSDLKPVEGDSTAHADHVNYAKPISEVVRNEQCHPFKTHRFHRHGHQVRLKANDRERQCLVRFPDTPRRQSDIFPPNAGSCP